MLEEGGDSVMHFSMKNPFNRPSKYSDYFVSQLDFDELHTIGDKLAAAGRIIYSFETKRKLTELLSMHRPDIAHAHNIYHQLSPSILHALEKFGIPTVMTAHDYKLACPNYLLYNEDHVCERCTGGRFYNALFTRCLRKSFLSGLTLTIEMYLHRMLKTYDTLRLIIAPSRFLMEKLIESGIPREKMVHVPNFVYDIPETVDGTPGQYVAYLGRLSREKGLRTLIKAVSGLDDLELRIAGSGPIRASLEELTSSLEAKNIRFVGQLKVEEVPSFISSAKFVVVPSEYYENCPLSILETMALGKPVIGAAIGGIPELINDREDGLLFRPADEEDLRSKMEMLAGDTELTIQMGKKAREKILTRYDRETHYNRLIDIYRDVLK
jgi:glycosyltransferase involved in cell wall biosynthesis